MHKGIQLPIHGARSPFRIGGKKSTMRNRLKES